MYSNIMHIVLSTIFSKQLIKGLETVKFFEFLYFYVDSNLPNFVTIYEHIPLLFDSSKTLTTAALYTYYICHHRCERCNARRCNVI